jgi:protein-disulfide isomerase
MAAAPDRKQRAERAEQMRKEREKADRKQRNLITVAIAVVVVALIALGAWAVSSAGGDDKPVGPLVKPAHTNAKYGVAYNAEDAGGTAGADPVKVIAYEDFQCPSCKAFEEQSGAHLDDLVKQGKITIEYRIFAFLDSKSSTEYSTRSASAAMAVLDKGGVAAFKKFHDLLYANQPPEGGAGLGDSALIALAKQAGVTGIDADVKDKTYEPWVRKAFEAGDADGIHSTPTIVVDGKQVEATSEAIDAAIAAAK